MRRSSGYTLIEILVGLTIIGILFSVGYVGFREFSRRQQLSGVIKEIKGDLRLAQARALSGQIEGCTSTLGGFTFDILDTKTYEIKAVCSGSPASKTVSVPGNITISSTIDPILFKVLGEGTNIPEGSQAEITFTQTETGTTAKVYVSHAGEIK